MIENLNIIGKDIIGAAFEVRKHLNKFLLERFYVMALASELRQKGHKVEIEIPINALYKGIQLGIGYRADLIVDDVVIIECKALTKIPGDTLRQIMTYLHLSNLKLGYIINFGCNDFSIGNFKKDSSLDKGIYRVVNNI